MWNNLGTATGWLPGAAIGTIGGAVVAALYWSSNATKTCSLGGSSIAIDCVQTAFGQFTSMESFFIACGAIGGIAGAIINYGASLRKQRAAQ